MKLKYNNKPTTVDGIRFASKKEARRYGELKALERNGEISQLKTQVGYPIRIQNRHITRYVADFTYLDREGNTVIEDAKGYRTQVYKLKKKMVEARYGVTIVEV